MIMFPFASYDSLSGFLFSLVDLLFSCVICVFGGCSTGCCCGCCMLVVVLPDGSVLPVSGVTDISLLVSGSAPDVGFGAVMDSSGAFVGVDVDELLAGKYLRST